MQDRKQGNTKWKSHIPSEMHTWSENSIGSCGIVSWYSLSLPSRECLRRGGLEKNMKRRCKRTKRKVILWGSNRNRSLLVIRCGQVIICPPKSNNRIRGYTCINACDGEVCQSNSLFLLLLPLDRGNFFLLYPTNLRAAGGSDLLLRFSDHTEDLVSQVRRAEFSLRRPGKGKETKGRVA